ncbi:hypothetical protein BGW36DRAFT_385485 [Talaromyces proteolyticus]|uniref:Zn(2)-C6 fungal-type domain-containing protein n=1 Tax=Talaromyces proteolyticus TaxID=1131652 RepID=A0AAD4PXA1_9EURO|nr:uncharacterized protein BGW36DRAFT_385485 [Talaromyces proteolyticus]KAH8692911.1 hypothetical protein BGW36DRAFT_385485 [Talaromyces proteolyticus]
MTRVGGRSRACITCRQRKIKCDLALPACSQCRRSRRHCPGPRTDAFFVHSIVSHDQTHQPLHPTHAFGLASTNRLLLMSAFDQFFVSNYIQSYGPRQSSATPPFWLIELPYLVSCQTAMPTVHCIRAVALLFYGNLIDNIAIQTEAYRMYGTALRSLSTLMQKYGTMSNNQSNPTLSDNLICAPIMLFRFQAMIGSPLHTWMSHLTAATFLLQTQGPEKCRSGLGRKFFLTVRLYISVMRLIEPSYNRPSFTLHEYLTIPFRDARRTRLDCLVDLLLCFPTEYDLKSESISAGSRLAGIAPNDICRMESYISKLEDWWRQNMSLPQGDDNNDKQLSPYSSSYLKRNQVTTDVYVLRSIALYNVALIVSLSHLSRLRLSPLLHKHQIELHCSQVIAACECMQKAHGWTPGSGATFPMILCLYIVGLRSPSQYQRQYANKKRLDWANTLFHTRK